MAQSKQSRTASMLANFFVSPSYREGILLFALIFVFYIISWASSTWVPGSSGMGEEYVMVIVVVAMEFARRKWESGSPKKPNSKSCVNAESAKKDGIQKHKEGGRQKQDSFFDYEQRDKLVAVVQAAAKSGDLAKAEVAMSNLIAFEETLKELHGKPIKLAVYGAMISAYSKAGDPEGAERWLNALLETGALPNEISVNILISSWAKAGNIAKAEEWLAKFVSLDIKASVLSYNAVIDACANGEDARRAAKWLAWMQEAGVVPNAVTYSTVMHACAKAGEVQQAEELLEQMRSHGVEPNVICFNCIINACTKVGEFDRAFGWIEHMKKSGVQPNVNTYSPILDTLAKRGDFNRAESLLWEIEAAGIECDAVCYNMLLHAYCKASESEKAMKLFKSMVRLGRKPNNISFNLLLCNHVKHGNAYEVAELLREMTSFGLPVDRITFNTAIKVFPKTGDVAAVVQFVQGMAEAGVHPDTTTYNAVIATSAKAGDIRQAEKWFKKLEEKCVPDAGSYGAMIEASVSGGDVVRAEFWLGRMVQAGISSFNLSSLVSSLAKAGETSSIERVFEKLDAADIEIGSYCYNALIAACVRQQDVDRAQKWLKIASQRDLADVASFSAVMHAYAKKGQVQACEDVFQAMEEATTLASQEDQYGEWNCKLCGSAQSKRGYQCKVCGGQMVQRARSVVSSGSDTKCIRANVVTFNCLINACAQCGDAKRAEMYLNKMLAADLRPTLTSFNTLLNACVKGGCIDRAEHWIRTMPSHGVSPCGVSYSTLINACVAAGDTSRAEDWMSVMTDPNSRTSERPTAQTLSYVYNTVITGLANKKKAARVQHWLEDAHSNDIVINRITYKLAGDVLHSAGRCDKANDCFMRAHNAPWKTQYKEKPGAAKGSGKGKGNAK